MSDKTILSVIVVTWNSDKEICKCIESVSASAEGINYEIIIVDNNSSDKTSDIVSGLIEKNSKIRFIQNTENKGYTKVVC